MKIRENIENFERIKLNKVAKFSDESIGRERLEEPDEIRTCFMVDRDRIIPVSYTHLTLPTIVEWCRSRWSPYH